VRKDAEKATQAVVDDDGVFYDNDLLFSAIDQALDDPETNAVAVGSSGEKMMLLRGPNAKSEILLQLVCARPAQVKEVEKRYLDRLMTLDELKGRLHRTTSYGMDSLQRVTFNSREEWERAWSTNENDFHLTEEQYHFYMSKEVWAKRSRDQSSRPSSSTRRTPGSWTWATSTTSGSSRPRRRRTTLHRPGSRHGFRSGPRIRKRGGQVRRASTLVTERTKRAYDQKEMNEDERRAMRQAGDKCDLFIFPDEMMPDAERSFPGEERMSAMVKYVAQRPWLNLQKWIPERETTNFVRSVSVTK
jgi:hypothetical protein